MSLPREAPSWWAENLPPRPPRPALRGETKADVCIVGGGFAGLSSARELLAAEPTMKTLVLEAERIGFGASGRNAGFAMPLFGLDPHLVAWKYGRQAVAEAQRFLEESIRGVGELVERFRIDCGYERTGMLTVAATRAQEKRLRKEQELFASLGCGDLVWLEHGALAERVRSPSYRCGRLTPHCALIDPARLAAGLAAAAEAAGAVIHEGSPALTVRRQGNGRLFVDTPEGRVDAGAVVLAVNAWAGAFPELARRQVAVHTWIVLSEPLAPERLEPIGWNRREGVEDLALLVHYYRLTPDNRLLLGGGDVGLRTHPGRRAGRAGVRLCADENARVRAELERFAVRTFPSLAGIRFERHWGGPVSVTSDFMPAIGIVGGDPRLVYVFGCIGHGVAHANHCGRIVRDLLLGRESETTKLFFVDRRGIRWPREPLFTPLARGIRLGMRAADRWAAWRS